MPIASQLNLDFDYFLSWVEQSSQAVIVVDHREMIQAVNRSFSELVQLRSEEIEGRSLTSLFATPFTIQSNGKYRKSIQGKLLCGGGNMVKTDIQMVSGVDQAQRYHALTFYPVPSHEHLMQKLFVQMKIGIWLQDEGQRILEFNSIASKYLGVRSSRVLHHSVDRFIAHLDPVQPDFQRLVSFLNSSLQKSEQMDFEWETRGKPYCFRLTKVPVKDPVIGFRGAFFVLENQTEPEQAWVNNRLATIGQVAAGTAHEIRNPLTSIRGFLQVIGHKLKENGQQKEQGYIDIMLKEINRINHLVNEFLLLSKPRHVQLKTIHIEEVLEDIIPIIKSEATYHNVTVVVEEECDNLPAIVADGELLKQVILNLCKNGIEAMVDGGVLTVRLGKDERKKRGIVEISDEGSGIPEQAMKKIFEPFYTTKENGTGLGLPICKQILREIGGSIEVKSEKNQTNFQVLIPMN